MSKTETERSTLIVFCNDISNKMCYTASATGSAKGSRQYGLVYVALFFLSSIGEHSDKKSTHL